MRERKALARFGEAQRDRVDRFVALQFLFDLFWGRVKVWWVVVDWVGLGWVHLLQV
jgi:hypothetical protein